MLFVRAASDAWWPARPGGAHTFLGDHVVEDRIMMPASSYVVTAWEALAAKLGKPMAEVGVTFEDVVIHQAVAAEEGQKVALEVLLAPKHRFYVRPALTLSCTACFSGPAIALADAQPGVRVHKALTPQQPQRSFPGAPLYILSASFAGACLIIGFHIP